MAGRLVPKSVWRTTAFSLSSRSTRGFASSQIRHDNKTAIVTGSSRGIGKSIALRLAQDGYDVCVNDVQANQKGIDEVVSQIKELGRKSVGAVGDVSDLSQVEDVIQTSVQELGPLSTMVANAGIAQVKPLLELHPDDFHRMFSINVYGVQNCYAAAAKQIISQGTSTKENPAKLIAAASIVAFKPFALLSHYSASKWAVRGLNQAYAMELSEHNITCNCYAPGIVGTQMWELIDEKLGARSNRPKGETIKKYVNELIALGRVSVPEDVSKLVSFLSSKDSDYITGQCMVVDGGIIFT